MEVWELPWRGKKMEIREANEAGSPSSEITITQYGKSLEGVRDRFNETANIKNIVRLPSYSGPDSNGRWSVTWAELSKFEVQPTSWIGWNRKKQQEKTNGEKGNK